MSIPAAILALARAAVPGVTVYDARVPDGAEDEQPPERYVALYMDNGTRDPAERVDHQSTSRTFRWQTTCVAPDREMAAWLAERLADAFTDARLTVPGWLPGLVEHTFSASPRPDELVRERPVVVAIDRYQLVAERTAG